MKKSLYTFAVFFILFFMACDKSGDNETEDKKILIPKAEKEEISLEEIDTTNWKDYIVERWEIQFKYPSDWKIEETDKDYRFHDDGVYVFSHDGFFANARDQVYEARFFLSKGNDDLSCVTRTIPELSSLQKELPNDTCLLDFSQTFSFEDGDRTYTDYRIAIMGEAYYVISSPMSPSLMNDNPFAVRDYYNIMKTVFESIEYYNPFEELDFNTVPQGILNIRTSRYLVNLENTYFDAVESFLYYFDIAKQQNIPFASLQLSRFGGAHLLNDKIYYLKPSREIGMFDVITRANSTLQIEGIEPLGKKYHENYICDFFPIRNKIFYLKGNCEPGDLYVYNIDTKENKLIREQIANSIHSYDGKTGQIHITIGRGDGPWIETSLYRVNTVNDTIEFGGDYYLDQSCLPADTECMSQNAEYKKILGYKPKPGFTCGGMTFFYEDEETDGEEVQGNLLFLDQNGEARKVVYKDKNGSEITLGGGILGCFGKER